MSSPGKEMHPTRCQSLDYLVSRNERIPGDKLESLEFASLKLGPDHLGDTRNLKRNKELSIEHPRVW